MIIYDKLFAMLKKRDVSFYKLRKEKVIGEATLTALRRGAGGLDYRSVDKLCAILDCQPGDLMEYMPDGCGQQMDLLKKS